MVRQQVCAIGKMLSAAKPDLEMKGAVFSKETWGRYRSIIGYGNLGQQPVHQVLLARAQRFANAAAIEPAKSGGVAFFECGHDKSLKPLRQDLSRDEIRP